MDDWKEWSKHVLTELQRLDSSHSELNKSTTRLEDKLDDQNMILLRNTISIEDHVKRTNLLESKIEIVDTEVEGLKSHVDKMRWLTGSFVQMLVFTGGFVTLICTVITSYYLIFKK